MNSRFLLGLLCVCASVHSAHALSLTIQDNTATHTLVTFAWTDAGFEEESFDVAGTVATAGSTAGYPDVYALHYGSPTLALYALLRPAAFPAFDGIKVEFLAVAPGGNFPAPSDPTFGVVTFTSDFTATYEYTKTSGGGNSAPEGGSTWLLLGLAVGALGGLSHRAQLVRAAVGSRT